MTDTTTTETNAVSATGKVAPTAITEIRVTAPGYGYTPGNYAAVITDTTGTGAAATILVDDTGAVTSVTLTENGLDYTNPTVTLPSTAGEGEGALLSAEVVPPLPVRYICIRTTRSGWQAPGFVICAMTVTDPAQLPTWPGKAWVADPGKYHENDIYPVPGADNSTDIADSTITMPAL